MKGVKEYGESSKYTFQVLNGFDKNTERAVRANLLLHVLVVLAAIYRSSQTLTPAKLIQLTVLLLSTSEKWRVSGPIWWFNTRACDEAFQWRS